MMQVSYLSCMATRNLHGVALVPVCNTYYYKKNPQTKTKIEVQNWKKKLINNLHAIQAQNCNVFSNLNSKGDIFFIYQVNSDTTTSLAMPPALHWFVNIIANMGVRFLYSRGIYQLRNSPEDCCPCAYPLKLVIGIHSGFQVITL